MKLEVSPYYLEFYHPFALAHGTRTGTQLAFVKIEHHNIVAYGEASLPPYRKETVASVTKWVKQQLGQVADLLSTNPFLHPNEIPFSAENPAASNALQTAILNWYAASENNSLASYFKQGEQTPELTLTVTKNDFPYLAEKLDLAKHFTHLKLKLTGSADDVEFVTAIRKKTALPFCIDVNQGCKNKEAAIKLADQLEKLNAVLLEQPLKDTAHDEHFWLTQRTQLPIIADESICLLEDLIQHHEAYSGVNIKLIKCGGILQAQQLLDFETNNPNFMKLIGCMSESSLGVATAAILATQCTMADLDAPFLNKNDPFTGFDIKNQQIHLAAKIAPVNKLI